MFEHPEVPGYEPIKLLGCNGHLIYLARHTATGHLVRLNVVHSCGDFAQRVADRLRREAQLFALFDHPNIVRLVEVSHKDDHGFFSAYEFIDGESLSHTIHDRERRNDGRTLRTRGAKILRRG